MPRLEFNYHPSTDGEIIAHCSNPAREVVGGIQWGNQVVKLSDEAVVKLGTGVSAEEATNLKVAYDLLNHNVVRVPLVYRFFTHENLGFILMEHIKGRTVGPSEYPALAAKTARVLTALSKIRSQTPGPLGGGRSQVLLWESEQPAYHTILDMESWFTRRLLQEDSKVELEELELVLCHLDLTPRNICWLEDDTLCLLDWASAGFYPRIFEVAILKIMAAQDGDFNELLLESMESLSHKEEVQLWLVIRSWGNSIRYTFNSKPNPYEVVDV